METDATVITPLKTRVVRLTWVMTVTWETTEVAARLRSDQSKATLQRTPPVQCAPHILSLRNLLERLYANLEALKHPYFLQGKIALLENCATKLSEKITMSVCRSAPLQ